jgi:hypothetical protein
MSLSLTSAVRVSKVNVGNAAEFHSMRLWDPSAQVCPARANVSDSGVVGVPRDSIDTYGQFNGCYSPLDRMTVENSLRPRYSIFLNADAIDTPGVGDEDLSSAAPAGNFDSQQQLPYDTRFGNSRQFGQQLPRFQMQPQVKYSSTAPSPNYAAGPMNDQIEEANKVGCFMATVGERRNCQLYA